MFTAIASIPQLRDPDAALRFASMLPRISAEAQVPMIGALADCESKKVLPALLTAVESSNQEVKLASLRALGKAGDASCVKPLSAYLSKATPKAVKKEAMGSLERLRGEEINSELLEYLKVAPADSRTSIIDILVTRRATDAVDALFQKRGGAIPWFGRRLTRRSGVWGPRINFRQSSISYQFERRGGEDGGGISGRSAGSKEIAARHPSRCGVKHAEWGSGNNGAEFPVASVAWHCRLEIAGGSAGAWARKRLRLRRPR